MEDRKKLPLDFMPIGDTLGVMRAKHQNPETRRHSRELRARLLPEQDELIREAAELAGISLSDWMRERLMKAARKEIAEVKKLEGFTQRRKGQ